jgi:hypothetical protein
MKRGPGRIERAAELSGSVGEIATELVPNLQSMRRGRLSSRVADSTSMSEILGSLP